MSPTDEQIRAAHKALAQLRDHMPRSDWHLDRLAEALPPLPPEQWKPRTKAQLSDAWNLGYHNLGPPLQWSVQARTDDIARMLEDHADEDEMDGCAAIAARWRRMAQRIRELE